jgi:hypothetical protein
MSDNKAQDQQAVENSRGLFSHGSDQHREFQVQLFGSDLKLTGTQRQ